jgi:hypothetical protein
LADCSSSVEIFRFVAQSIVVAIGWLVVHRFSAAREKDKAQREMLADAADVLTEMASDVLLDARRYHVTKRDPDLELKLKMTLQDMATRTSGLSEVSEDVATLSACRSAVQGLRRSITGRHFEDEHDDQLDDRSTQLEEIASDAMRVKQCFLRLKYKQFPKRVS